MVSSSSELPDVSKGENYLHACISAEVCAEAIAGMLLFRGVNGQDLIVDGGCSMLGFDYGE